MTELAPDPELLPTADEATTLYSFLDYYRTVLIRKAEGLSEQQARLVLPPSDLTLLGLVRHMAEVEQSWFRRRFMDDPVPFLYCTDEDPDADFHPDDGDTMSDAIAALRAQIDYARTVTADVSMEAIARANPAWQRIPDWQPTLRWIVVHMIEEYARHCGHADLLRQAADGAVGD